MELEGGAEHKLRLCRRNEAAWRKNKQTKKNTIFFKNSIRKKDWSSDY